MTCIQTDNLHSVHVYMYRLIKKPKIAGVQNVYFLPENQPMGRLEHIMLFFLPIILFHNSSYFNLLFPYYHPIILINLLQSESMRNINNVTLLVPGSLVLVIL